MPGTLLKNIKSLFGTRQEIKLLRGKELQTLPHLDEAFLIIEDKQIADFGSMSSFNYKDKDFKEVEDLTNQFVLPAYCDSHSHLVFGNYRETEFVDKINGLSYGEIAAKGGGILNSAKSLQLLSENQLFNLAWERLKAVSKSGTGALEIKSGYGLTADAEIKMLRVIKRLKAQSNLQIKATFLGAHAFPPEFKDNHAGYLQEIIDIMLPQIAKENLADYIDVFCENGFFSVQEMEQVCNAGRALGLIPKLHVNQLNSIGGIQSAIKLKAKSVDHLEVMTEQDIIDLSASDTIATLLPGAAFYLRMNPPPARKLIESNAAVALASDFNPGSCPTGNMNMIVSLACIQMKMLPEEAINAATVNGAFAMDLRDKVGVIKVGHQANLIVTKPVSSLAYLPYSFGDDNISHTYTAGERN